MGYCCELANRAVEGAYDVARYHLAGDGAWRLAEAGGLGADCGGRYGAGWFGRSSNP